MNTIRYSWMAMLSFLLVVAALALLSVHIDTYLKKANDPSRVSLVLELNVGPSHTARALLTNVHALVKKTPPPDAQILKVEDQTRESSKCRVC